MKNKNYFKKLTLAFLVILGFTNGVHAQVPSYVPSNGLVGYWPFTGNANDLSANANNGTVNGATLTTDRFGNANSAYLFQTSSTSQYISTNYTGISGNNNRSISLWFYQNTDNSTDNDGKILSGYGGTTVNSQFSLQLYKNRIGLDISDCTVFYSPNTYVNWHHYVITYNNLDGSGVQSAKVYLDGVLLSTTYKTYNLPGVINTLTGINFYIGGGAPINQLNGKIDDVGFWNRVLTPNEITALYQGCSKPTVTPLTAAIKTGENVTFNTPANANATFQWQTNPANVGWQNLSDNTTYSGTATNALTLTNGQAYNNGQSFRVTANATGCNETSEPVTVTISDVCTNYTTVTDLLVINVGTLSTNTPNYKSTITIYPNPAKDQITIDCGTLANVTGYQIKIVNTLGQEVYKTSLNQQQFTIPLNSWTGKGLYFVSLYDNNNVLVTTRKIELQ